MTTYQQTDRETSQMERYLSHTTPKKMTQTICKGDMGTPPVDMLTVKLHLNSVISTPGAQYYTINLKAFYLNTPMAWPEYMRTKLTTFPKFAKQYNLANNVESDGDVSHLYYDYCLGLAEAKIGLEALFATLTCHNFFNI